MRSLLTAVAFLTVLPVPGGLLHPRQDCSRCVGFFPVVGILIGGIAGLIAWGLAPWVPALPAAVILAGCLTAISGALHLDGLADTADGFLSGRPRERVLEIMRDSRIGAMGVIAVLFVVLLKVTVISSAADSDPSRLLRGVVLMPVAGRCSLIWAMWMNRYVRESGLGRVFWIRSWLLSALGLAFVSAAGVALLGQRGALAVLAAVAVTGGFSFWCWRRIGGATGDTLGACCELTEAAFLLVAVSPGGKL